MANDTQHQGVPPGITLALGWPRQDGHVDYPADALWGIGLPLFALTLNGAALTLNGNLLTLGVPQ